MLGGGLLIAACQQGLRVLAVATRSFTKDQSQYGEEDEHDLLLKGFLAFQDPPKLDAQPALKGLKDLGIHVKVTFLSSPCYLTNMQLISVS